MPLFSSSPLSSVGQSYVSEFFPSPVSLFLFSFNCNSQNCTLLCISLPQTLLLWTFLGSLFLNIFYFSTRFYFAWKIFSWVCFQRHMILIQADAFCIKWKSIVTQIHSFHEGSLLCCFPLSVPFMQLCYAQMIKSDSIHVGHHLLFCCFLFCKHLSSKIFKHIKTISLPFTLMTEEVPLMREVH